MAAENPKGNLVSRLPLVGPAYLFLAEKTRSLSTRITEHLLRSMATEIIGKSMQRHMEEDQAFNFAAAFYILSGGEGDGTIDLNHFGPPPEYDKNGYPKRPSRVQSALGRLKNIFTRNK